MIDQLLLLIINRLIVVTITNRLIMVIIINQLLLLVLVLLMWMIVNMNGSLGREIKQLLQIEYVRFRLVDQPVFDIINYPSLNIN